MTTIGLIISTYNWPEALDRVLASAVDQSLPPIEIIVADDGSGPETAEVVRQWAARSSVPITHVWQEDDGFRLSRVRNLAILRATAEYLIILDGDEVLHRDFVLDHFRAAEPNEVLRGSRAALSQAQTVTALRTGRLPRWWSKGLMKRAAAIRLPLLSCLLRHWQPKGTQGHYLACWRRDAIRVNGFDERFSGWGGEDAEFVIRLFNTGVTKRRLRFSGVMYHLYHPPAPREGTYLNHAIYEDTVAAKRTRAVQGLDQHQAISA